MVLFQKQYHSPRRVLFGLGCGVFIINTMRLIVALNSSCPFMLRAISIDVVMEEPKLGKSFSLTPTRVPDLRHKVKKFPNS